MQNLLNLSQCKWRFRNISDDRFFSAVVPGCVHTDLYKNRQIPDPFYGLNAKKLQWIEKASWEYSCEFNVTAEMLRWHGLSLLFKGLDTYADVFLNGKFLFKAENMFVPWEHDVKKILTEGSNNLKVILHSPFLKGLGKYKKLPYHLPANNDASDFRVSPFTRKAPYMYGWDWAPRLLTSGIWKDVLLVGNEKAGIRDTQVILRSLSEEEATLSVESAMTCDKPGQHKIQIRIDNEVSTELSTFLPEGDSHHSFEIRVPHPKLWWPRGFGDQHLYSFRIILSDEENFLDEFKTSTGIRIIELVRDRDEEGHSFHFKINGKNIFIRGANLIPVDFFVSGVKEKDYEALTDNAIAVNMNMLRAWGGAVYEDDYFYQLCDRKGIMVWQDFMFACGMYPSDKSFLAQVGNEIKHHVIRLRNHPSVVLWCGNNEILEGYHTWGWKDELNGFADEAFESYKRIFHELIPGILEELDPTRPYWPSSPFSGEESIISLKSGDYHYWDIVKKILPITSYQENIGRFMSEYGFKSYPSLKTIEEFAGTDGHNIHSETMEFHQGWPGGAELVEKNLEWFYLLPSNFNDFIYLSQLLQADAIKGAIEAHRRAKPYCMGTLYWQFNDCWPTASWAGIDYFGRWKALQYQLKTAYSDLLVSAVMKKNKVSVYLISDLPEELPVAVNLRIMDFRGNEIFFINLPVTADPGKTIRIFEQDLSQLRLTEEPDRYFLDMNVFRKDHLLSHNSFYFVRPGNLKLEEPGLEMKSEKVFDKIFLFLKSSRLVKNLYINHNEFDGFFSDNFFDLLPGEEKIVIFQSDKKSPSTGSFTLLSLYDVLKKNNKL